MTPSSPLTSSPVLGDSSVTASTRNSHTVYSRRTRSRMVSREDDSEHEDSSGTEETKDGSPTHHTKKRPRLQSGPTLSEQRAIGPKAMTQNEAQTAAPDSPSKADRPSPPNTPTKASQRSKPRTPTASPRNLSGLFTDLGSPSSDRITTTGSPTNSPARRGGMGLRRMLTKAQSLADNFGSPSRSPSGQGSVFGQASRSVTPSRTLGRTQSLPHSPYTDLFSSPRSGGLSIISGDTGNEESTPGKTRRTYGRHSQALERTQDDNDTVEGGNLDARPHQSYAELRKRFEIDNSVMDTGSGSGNLMSEFLQAQAPQPVTDMRSKGENRRFLDEISYLAEGIARPSATSSVKRSSSIDILNNMQNESWASKVYLCGQSETLWDTFLAARGDGDEVMEAVCLLFLAILEQTDGELKSILHSSSLPCIDLLLGELHKKGRPLDQKNVRIGPTARLIKIHSSLDEKTTTSRGLASRLLNACLQPLNWQTLQQFPSEVAFSSILKAIRFEVEPIIQRLGLYEKGLELVRSIDDFDIEHLRCCLGMFSTLPLLSAGNIRLDTLPKSTARLFVDTIQLSSSMVKWENESSLTARYCVVEALQALAMMANLSKGWALETFKSWEAYPLAWVIIQREMLAGEKNGGIFSSSDPVSTQKGKGSDSLLPSSEDILCSALSILASALKEEGAVADQLAKINVSEKCCGRRECARHCHCDDACPLSVHLARIFCHYDDTLVESSRIICGYIALVLISLLVALPELRQGTLAALPGSGDKEKYKRVSERLKSLESMLEQAGVSSADDGEVGEGSRGAGEMAVLSRAVEAVEGMVAGV